MVDQNTIFGGMLTNHGAAKKTNCDALGIPWEPRYMLIGDANGTDPVPNPVQTQLVHQVYRAQLNQLYVSPADDKVLVAELVLPPDVGGWWVRELALEDKDGVFSAVANVAPSYKPQLAQNSGRNQVVRMHIITNGTANIQLKIDPSVVLATREYVDTEIIAALNKQDFKHSVLVATTANIALSGAQTIDGVVVPAGSRVLVRNQAVAKDNGLYVTAVGAWSRAPDADASIEVTPGLFVHVEQGTANGDSVWQLTTDTPIVLGTTALTFDMIAGKTGVTAGTFRSMTVDAKGRVIGGTNPTTLGGYGITDAQPFAQILADFVANGGWGLGQNTPANITDANTAIYPGFYGAGGAAGTNFADLYSPLLVMRRQSGNVIGQLQINARDNVMSFRGSPDGGASWTQWVHNWHSGNLVKTISPTDTTPGAMLKVADHGIGGLLVSTEADLNNYRVGSKNITPAVGVVNLPAGWGQGRHILEVSGGSNYTMQLLMGASVNKTRIAVRSASDVTFQEWQELWHTDNLKASTQAQAEAGTDNLTWMTPLRVFQAIAKVVVQATETVFGWAKVATQVQVTTGTDDATIVTPKKLRDAQATQVEAEAGANNTKVMTPLRVLQLMRAVASLATEALYGTLRIGTQVEVDAGALDMVAVTPKKMKWGFSASFTTNGYVVFPTWLGSFIIQWANGQINAGAGTAHINLALEFPYALLAYSVSTSSAGTMMSCQGASVNGIDVNARTVSAGALSIPAGIVGYTFICVGK
ncbi:phage tail protein [Pseudomonas sp. EA_15y_Pfl2_R67]|uniref:phage tail protein n=1 Tax=Pseudomonas sp. EA_15y_Pfl2_R67 TaxID=3088687 RepID=UPI0030DA7FE8